MDIQMLTPLEQKKFIVSYSLHKDNRWEYETSQKNVISFSRMKFSLKSFFFGKIKG